MKTIFDRLEKRLSQKLPGDEAHAVMATVGRMEKAKQVPSDHRTSAVLVLLYPHLGEWCIPLIRRPDYDGVHSGQMAFPGGKTEETDRDVTDTALRETHEEIGVAVPRNKVVGRLSNLYIPPSNMLVTPIVAFASGKPTYQTDPYEVAKVVDIKVADLFNAALQTEKTITVMDSFKLKAPTFQLEGETVWGATAMMLSEFKVLWEEVMLGE